MNMPGKKMINYSTTVSTTLKTIVADGIASCENGKIMIFNPNAAGNFWLGLAGEVITANQGIPIPPGGGIVIDNPANNAITGISDTIGLFLTVYLIPGD